MAQIAGRGRLFATPDGYRAMCARCTLIGDVPALKAAAAQEALGAHGWKEVDARWYCPGCVEHYQAVNRMLVGREPLRPLSDDGVGWHKQRGPRLVPDLPDGVSLEWFQFQLTDGTVTKDPGVAVKARKRGEQVICMPRPAEERKPRRR